MYYNNSLFTGWLNYPIDVHQRLAECIGIQTQQTSNTSCMHKKVLFMTGRLLGTVKLTKHMTRATLKKDIHTLLCNENPTKKYHEPSHHIGLWNEAMADLPDKDMYKTISSSHDPLVVIPGVFDISKMTFIRTYGMATLINSVSWDPSGKYLASGSDNKTLKLWDVSTGTCLRTFTGHPVEI